MFGLMSTEQFKTYRSLNSRRRVFYQYPNGAAPLIGLLSLMETEETDKPEFGWFEDRMSDQKATLGTISSGNGALSAGGGDTPLTAGGSNIAENDLVRVKVDDTSKFRVTNVIQIRKIPTSGAKADLTGVVTSIVSSTKFEIRVIAAITGAKNADTGATATTGLKANVIGTANQEGARSTKGFWVPPKNPTNYTQIFRTAFSFTRTALKVAVTFDATGIYKSKAKQNSLRHMVEIEKAFMFGYKQEYIATSTDGEQVPERNTGGIMWFLRQWELGTPYGVTAATASNSDPNKRILDFVGSMSLTDYNQLVVAKVFKVTSNEDFSKLGFCGGGYLGVVNELFEGRLTITSPMTGGDTYGMQITTHETLNGTVYYKTHPLFNLDDDLNFSCLYLDVNNLAYRPYTDSDTILLKNRQDNDEDRRKDEWITECGEECRMPESHLFVEGANTAG